MLRPTDYEKALHDFLEEFAGGAKFIGQSDSDDAPHLLAVLTRVVAGAIGRAVTFDAARARRLLEHGFWHGNAAAGSRIVLFFHSQAPKHRRGYADARGSGHDRRGAISHPGALTMNQRTKLHETLGVFRVQRRPLFSAARRRLRRLPPPPRSDRSDRRSSRPGLSPPFRRA